MENIQALFDYWNELKDINIDFIKETINNQAMLQLYIEQEILDNNCFVDYETAQLENYLLMPWYKKITRKQREKILKTPCTEAAEIIYAYNIKRKDLQEKKYKILAEREEHDKD